MNDFTTENENTHVIDVDSIEGASRELIPNGWVDGVITEHDYALSQNSGQPMWSTVITIEGGQYDGRKLYYHMSWAPKAAPFTKAVVQKCFADVLTNPVYRTPSNKLDIKKIGDESAFVGRRVRVKVGAQTYEGEKRNNIRDLAPAADRNEFLGA